MRGWGRTVAFQLIAAPERVRLHRLAANLQLHHHEPNHPVHTHDAVFFATQSRFQQRWCDLRRDQVDPQHHAAHGLRRVALGDLLRRRAALGHRERHGGEARDVVVVGLAGIALRGEEVVC